MNEIKKKFQFLIWNGFRIDLRSVRRSEKGRVRDPGALSKDRDRSAHRHLASNLKRGLTEHRFTLEKRSFMVVDKETIRVPMYVRILKRLFAREVGRLFSGSLFLTIFKNHVNIYMYIYK